MMDGNNGNNNEWQGWMVMAMKTSDDKQQQQWMEMVMDGNNGQRW